MHETSLVQALLRQAAAVLDQHGGAGLEQIRVEIGPLSGVEPLLVASAFDRLVEATACRGAVLVIEEVDLGARCCDCSHEFTIEQYRFVCPACASRAVQVTRGDEFRLLDVTLRAGDDAELSMGERL